MQEKLDAQRTAMEAELQTQREEMERMDVFDVYEEVPESEMVMGADYPSGPGPSTHQLQP